MRILVVLFGVLLSFGCSHKVPGDSNPPGSGDGSGDGSGTGNGANVPFAPSALEVKGQVVDFLTQQPLTGAMTMATAALVPAPNVSVNAPDFTIEGVPPYSSFFLIAGSPPDHRLTYNPPTDVVADNLADVTAYSVADSYLTTVRNAAATQPKAGTATVFVHAVDGSGKALAGVPGAAITLGGAAGAPVYLDATLLPQANATATSASGWLVYFDVPAGTVTFGGGAGWTVKAADTPADNSLPRAQRAASQLEDSAPSRAD